MMQSKISILTMGKSPVTKTLENGHVMYYSMSSFCEKSSYVLEPLLLVSQV